MGTVDGTFLINHDTYNKASKDFRNIRSSLAKKGCQNSFPEYLYQTLKLNFLKAEIGCYICWILTMSLTLLDPGFSRYKNCPRSCWMTPYHDIIIVCIKINLCIFLGTSYIKWWYKWWWEEEKFKFWKIVFCQRFQEKPQKHWGFQWISLWIRKCAGWYHSSRCKAEQYWSHRLHLNFNQIGL